MTTTTGDQLAVISQTGSTVTFFDATGHELLDVVDVPPQPHELCYDPDHRLLYCSSTYRSGYYDANEGRSHELTVIDVDTHTVVTTLDLRPDHGPHGLALDGRRSRLYVSVEATDTEPGGVLILDSRTHTRLGRIPTMAPGPHWLVVTPDGRRGYTTNKEAPFVSVLDLDRGAFTDRIPVPGSEGLALTPDGRQLIVATPKADHAPRNQAEPALHIIDTTTDETVRTVPTKGHVMPVHITTDGTLLTGALRPDPEPGVLTVHAPETFTPIGEVEVGRFPLTVTSSLDGRRAYVSGHASSTVTVVDLRTLQTVATLAPEHTGISGTHGLAYIEAARN
jgi:DNA-binding beta-propeller fold protein YncE